MRVVVQVIGHGLPGNANTGKQLASIGLKMSTSSETSKSTPESMVYLEDAEDAHAGGHADMNAVGGKTSAIRAGVD